ncbi:MAG: High potential iron-sulfur protein [Betaproteobacteria bacterium]|nr:High potential iron-sulfur protein [Betaproteobacteria bacterium]
MTQEKISKVRRGFLKVGSLAVGALALSTRAGTSLAQPKAQDTKGALPRVDEKDATAQGLGYKHDATKVDKAKFKQYAAGQNCANCQLYQAKATDAWGPCTIFPGKQVAGKGWCSAWVKKA